MAATNSDIPSCQGSAGSVLRVPERHYETEVENRKFASKRDRPRKGGRPVSRELPKQPWHQQQTKHRQTPTEIGRLSSSPRRLQKGGNRTKPPQPRHRQGASQKQCQPRRDLAVPQSYERRE